jgi:hypothetical protein
MPYQVGQAAKHAGNGTVPDANSASGARVA